MEAKELERGFEWLEPTDFVSSAVDVKKPSSTLGVCRDPRELNRYVKVQQLSTIDDITSKLGKSQVFTFLDAKDGFRQVNRDEGTSKLTTFHTPFGRYKMPFGKCSAPEEFQTHVLQ